tara:strand:- start:234 stop:698 length:465 start_codon:yes stop_codon:yes gene_type:complete
MINKKSTKKKQCPKGSRRNSTTGRCRKIKSNKSTKSKKLKSLKKSTKKIVNKVEKCFANQVVIKKSTNSEKKLMAIFTNKNKSKKKTVHFGANGMSDYTIHKDKDRMERYLNRHRKRENWEQCDTAGALSRWILWNKPSLQASIKDYKKKFKLK